LRGVTELPPFQPLRDRLAGLPLDETLHDDVPEWLDLPLHDWLNSALAAQGDEAERLASRVLMRLQWTKQYPNQSYVARLGMASGMNLLTIIDALLHLHPGWEPCGLPYGPDFPTLVWNLDEALTDSASLYQVDFDRRCLVRRVDATVQTLVNSAVTGASASAAEYLRAAWVAAYGLHPDPDKAYDNAILAIEEQTCPLVSPQNDRATLGTVIRDLRSQNGQWELSIGDTATGQTATIDAVINMLNLLWKGQSRHAGSPNSRPQTQAEAEAAVHMSAALTQWLTSGVLRRRP
jgi:hypothetical protein